MESVNSQLDYNQKEENQKEGMISTLAIMRDFGVDSKEQMASYIVNELIKMYNKAGKVFTNNFGNQEGINTLIIGGNSLLLLLNSIGFIDELVEVGKVKQIILENMHKVINYIENYGFDFTPFVPKERLDNIFDIKNKEENILYEYFSLETLTWYLSYLIQLRRAIIDHKLEVSHEISVKIIDMIGICLINIEKSAIFCEWYEDDNKEDIIREKAGWGFLSKSKIPSLYYTTLVMEVLSEIDDNIFVRDINLRKTNKPDNELIEALGSELKLKKNPDKSDFYYVINKHGIDENSSYQGVLGRLYSAKSDYSGALDGLMQKTSHWIWYTYKDQLIDGKLVLDDYCDNDEVYYFIFIMEVMSISYTELFVNKSVIEDTIEAGLFHLDRKIKKIKDDKIGFLRNLSYRPEIIGLVEKIDAKTENEVKENKIINKLNSELRKYVLFGPSLTPLRIKFGSMYAFYFTKYPDKKMAGELKDLLVNKSVDNWFWDKEEFSLISTEKAIEALVDFFNYFDSFEKKYIDKSEKDEEIRRNIKKEIHDAEIANITLRVKTEMEEKQQDFETRLANREKELADTTYLFQSQLKSFIYKCIDERINEKKERGLVNDLNILFDKVISYNRKELCENAEEFKELSDKLKQVSISNLYKTAFEESQKKFDSERVLSIFEQDYKIFLQDLFSYIEDTKGDETKIKDLVKNLKKNNIL